MQNTYILFLGLFTVAIGVTPVKVLLNDKTDIVTYITKQLFSLITIYKHFTKNA